MKLYPECYVCVLRQALSACRFAGMEKGETKAIVKEALGVLYRDETDSSLEIVREVQSIIQKRNGVADPYKEQKRVSTEKALAMYPRMRELIDSSDDPFDTAVRLSIAGNIIDFGVREDYHLEDEVERVLKQPYAIDRTATLRKAIEAAESILYLADNAGETVFDRLLIETLGKPVVYAVKGTPILNDAVRADAEQAGIDGVAEIISSGADTPGTVLRRCDPAFRERFDGAELIIAKGQGNFEALSEEQGNLFFLLQSKCEALSRELGTETGSLIVQSARGGKRQLA